MRMHVEEDMVPRAALREAKAERDEARFCAEQQVDSICATLWPSNETRRASERRKLPWLNKEDHGE